MENVAQQTQPVLHEGQPNQQKIDGLLESLCGEGCKAVWGVIENLECGAALPQTDGLSERELDTLLAELKSIMAVYAGTCGS
jgi:hypothetical protein